MPSNGILPPPYEGNLTEEKIEFSTVESSTDGNSPFEAHVRRLQIREACLTTAAIVCLPTLFGYIVWCSEFLKGWFHERRWIYLLSLCVSSGLTIAGIFKPAIRRGASVFQLIAITLMAGYLVAVIS